MFEQSINSIKLVALGLSLSGLTAPALRGQDIPNSKTEKPAATALQEPSSKNVTDVTSVTATANNLDILLDGLNRLNFESKVERMVSHVDAAYSFKQEISTSGIELGKILTEEFKKYRENLKVELEDFRKELAAMSPKDKTMALEVIKEASSKYSRKLKKVHAEITDSKTTLNSPNSSPWDSAKAQIKIDLGETNATKHQLKLNMLDTFKVIIGPKQAEAKK